MFQVQNQATYSQFQVNTRDELLLELDLLNARQKKKGAVATFDLSHLDQDGRLLEKRSLTFPLETTVDEALADFSPAEQKKAGFFKRLFSFKKKEKKVEVPEEGGSVSQEERVVEEEERVEEKSLADLFTSTTLKKEEIASDETVHEEEITEEAEIAHQDSIYDHVADQTPLEEELEEAEVVEPILNTYEREEKEESTSNDATLQEIEEPRDREKETPSMISDLTPPLLKVTSTRDVESLTVTRHKQSFELQLQAEVDEIDELIQRLQKQKEGHLKLLHHIQQFATE